MNKKNLAIIIAVIVVLAGAGIFLNFSKFKKNGLSAGAGSVKNLLNQGKEAASNITNSDKSLGETIKGTFEQIVSGGKSMKCTFSENNGGTKSNSTLFVSGKKVSLEGTTTNEDNEESKFYMISDGDWAYTWDSKQSYGIKMKYSDFNKDENGQETNKDLGQNIFEALKGRDYNCIPWIEDGSKFVPPSNIEFKDLSAMMQGIKESTDKMKVELCQNCEKLDTQEQIDSCKQGLECE